MRELPAHLAWAMSKVTRVCAVVAASSLVILLAGCTSTATPQPTSSATSLFDGNCENLFDPVELATTYAEEPGAYGQVNAGDLMFNAVGGINCVFRIGWNIPDESGAQGGGTISITVVPATVTGATAVQASLLSGSCTDDGYEQSCTATGVVDAWWYTVSIYGSSWVSLEGSAFATIKQDLEDELADVAVVEPLTLAQPLDCSAAELGGLPVARSRAMEHYDDSALATAAFLLAGPVTCDFTLPAGEHWKLTVYPNAAAAFSACAGRDPVVLRVEGVASAASVTEQNEDSNGVSDEGTLCATDGASLIRVRHIPPHEEEIFESGDPTWTPRSLAEASKFLVAMFDVIPESSPWTPSAAVTTQVPLAPLADGHCEDLLETSMIAASLNRSNIQLIASDLRISTAGGINCTYIVGDQHETQLSLTVAPSAIFDPRELPLSLAAKQCAPGSGCSATGTIGGWWYSLSVPDEESLKLSSASFDTILANLKIKLDGVEAPTQAGGLAPFDCDAADTDGVPDDERQGGGWGGLLPPATPPLGAATTCTYTLYSGASLHVTVYPGAASSYAQCAVPGEYQDPKRTGPISVPGVKAAYGGKADAENGGLDFCATDGTSIVEVFTYDHVALNTKSLAKVGALLVKVFAAAD